MFLKRPLEAFFLHSLGETYMYIFCDVSAIDSTVYIILAARAHFTHID